MRSRAVLMILSSLLSCAGLSPARSSVEITLAHHTASEEQTKSQLLALLRRFPLTPWLYTRQLVIDEESTPHSHPVLTLHARHLNEDHLLLSTFVHEQMHWFLH